MKKFKMNNRNWKIIELSQEEIREHIIKYKYDGQPTEYGRYYGQTYCDEQTIYLDKDLHIEQKKITLMHELMHCYINCYITHQEQQYSEEDICNISANSNEIINKIVEAYFEN